MSCENKLKSANACYMSLLLHACPLKRVYEPDVPLLPQDRQPVYRMLLQVPLKIHQKQCVGHFLLPFNHIWALQYLPLQTFFNKKSLSSQRRSSSQEGSLSCRDMNHLRHISEGGYEVMRIFMWCSTHMLSILRMYPVYSKNEIPIPWFFCFNLYNSYFWNVNRTTCLLSHLKF